MLQGQEEEEEKAERLVDGANQEPKKRVKNTY